MCLFKKKKISRDDEIIKALTKFYPLTFEEIKKINDHCKSIDRTVQIIDYKMENNLSVDSAINILG
jgi:hypothetical protein